MAGIREDSTSTAVFQPPGTSRDSVEGCQVNIQGLALRAYNGAQKLLARTALEISPSSDASLGLRGMGHGEGQWMVPMGRIKPGAICYCVGVGSDASLDVALAEEGMKVFSFDPTPKSIKYMSTVVCDGLSFLPYGIWKETKTLKFYAPMTPDQVNFSLKNIHATGRGFEAECFRLSDMMNKLGHDRIDFLKLDIEGSWYEVVKDMLASKITPSVLCVEFDTPTSLLKASRMLRLLYKNGYHPIHKQRDNFVFVRQGG